MRPAWAKTGPDNWPAHALVHHSMDVAAVLETLLEQTVFGQRLEKAVSGEVSAQDLAWLSAFAFLHDVGKLSPAFQSKAWSAEEKIVLRGHLEEGAAWINTLPHRHNAMGRHAYRLLSPLANCGNKVFGRWVDALFAHHGRPVPIDPCHAFPVVEGYDWLAEEALMGEALDAWFPLDPPSETLLKSHRALNFFAGLLALADWVGSDTDHFPHLLDPAVPGYAATARARAEVAVRRLGLVDPAWPETPPSFEGITGFETPRGPQHLIEDLPLASPLMILEAETGSGKTEAALWHFARLRSAGHVDALYFAVPTRAAAGQLQRRVDEAMRRVGGPEAILAVPGLTRAGAAEGRRLPDFTVLWDDGPDYGARWAAAQSTRFLAAPVAVGTVDQVLMGGLKVKHAAMRAAALARSLLVIDEVHASDVYMNRIARGIVSDHVAIGGHALLMSATLGSTERAGWLDTDVDDIETAIDAPYPALWRGGCRTPIRDDSLASAQKRVIVELVPTMDAVTAAASAVEAAARGARVLVIRNSVKEAVATWRHLLALRPDLCLSVAGAPALHHSRFAMEDRALLDTAIEAALGKGSAQGGLIAIGTQTLEQSLDIDADLLISDLCPMDVLLQRIGRLHRHGRTRPQGFDVATAKVMAPEAGLERLARGPAFENGLGSWEAAGGVIEGVYLDLRSVEATRRLVETGGPWSIPADNRRLVEAATHPDALVAIEAEMGWETYTRRVLGKELAEMGHAGMLAFDRGRAFPTCKDYPNADETVQTRLGARGPLLDLPDGTTGPFGHNITQIAPPAHWCRGMTGEEKVTVAADGADLVLSVAERRFRYGRHGLARTE